MEIRHARLRVDLHSQPVGHLVVKGGSEAARMSLAAKHMALRTCYEKASRILQGSAGFSQTNAETRGWNLQCVREWRKSKTG